MIEENNVLIAKFMDYEIAPNYIGDTTFVFKDGTYEVPKFDSNWQWLMPVVEKIEVLCSTAAYTECFDEVFLSTKIEKTYSAVIEFINWYNQQTP